ncbi:uncharacterized protein LOC128735233 [Sabethes cyaneus]|uniref:uncharacterized protein LOC128735233 n=1 Tax=Sabethes cyaneus TaxID=53552 RepID=UPI00237DBBE4|nr:uncharacterized protein LOC128735233 [Sabethes cyaneus]
MAQPLMGNLPESRVDIAAPFELCWANFSEGGLTTKAKINDFLLRREVEWDFIPPRSPNFGGLWEAGVKVVKLHLTRTLGNVTMTFEEFHTVLTHVESIVNSRLLYFSSDDPNDPQSISPAHLMFGRPLEPMPKPSYADVPANRLT